MQCIFILCSQHGSKLRICCALSRKDKQAAIEGRRICEKSEFLAMSALEDACSGEACYLIMGPILFVAGKAREVIEAKA